MGVFDKLQKRFADLKEAEIDFGPVSNNVLILRDMVNEFPCVYEDEPVTAGLFTGDIVLTEVSLGKQERGIGVGQTDDWMLVLETTFACPGAKLGVIEEGEFLPLPIYDDPDFEAITSQTPLIFGQLLRADYTNSDDESLPNKERISEGAQLAEFKQLLDDSGYIGRSPRESNPEFVGTRDRLWSVQASNRRTGTYSTDLAERIANGLLVDQLTIVPPSPDREVQNENQFTDLLNAFMRNIDRVTMGLQEEDPAAKRLARRLMSSLTGAVAGEDRVYAGRATIPALTITVSRTEGVGARAHTVSESKSFSFWGARVASNETAPSV